MTDTVLDTLFMPIEPVAKQRPRKGSNGNWYTPAPTRMFEQAVQLYLRSKGVRETVSDDVVVRVTFHVASRKRCDLDNFLKSLFDACNGIVWDDDEQVVECHAWVRRGEDVPGITFTVYNAS